MRIAKSIILTGDEEKTLRQWASSRRVEVRKSERAKVILMASEGMQTNDIAAELGISRQKAARWRNRFVQLRLNGIEKDAPRGGRPSKLVNGLAEKIIDTTVNECPENASCWSVRTLAKHLGISPSLVHRVWKANNLNPFRKKTSEKRV